MPARRHKRARPAAALAGALAIGLLLAWALGAFGSESNALTPRISAREARALAEAGAPAPPHGEPVSVSIGEGASGKTVPPDFLGLSFEATAMPLLARYAHAGNLVTLLRSLGRGVIRVGGVSADSRVAWARAGSPKPTWASVVLTPADLWGIGQLARESGWKVLLTVNLGHFEPRVAAQEAASAHALLGNTLAGIAIGNEPDRYGREGLRDAGWSPSNYLTQLDAYRAALARAAPGVAVVAPDASSGIPPLPWVTAAAGTHPALLSDHYYPLSSCDGEKPALGELASPVLRAHEDDMLHRLRAIEQDSGLALTIDETGSISCHGEPGVSNSFESALWASDWIARAMGAGVAGLDFHDLVTESGAYSPLVLPGETQPSAGTEHLPVDLHANPDWYALLLTSPLVGGTPVPTHVAGQHDLTAATFTTGTGAGRQVKVLLVDFEPPSAKPLAVHLQTPPAYATGSVLRLMAPSSASLSHVQLGGAEVVPSGSWRNTLPLPSLYSSPSGPSLELPASSAALVTLETGSGTPR
jgi:hypothetical protein